MPQFLTTFQTKTNYRHDPSVCQVIPNCFYYKRSDFALKKIIEFAKNQEFTDLLVFSTETYIDGSPPALTYNHHHRRVLKGAEIQGLRMRDGCDHFDLFVAIRLNASSTFRFLRSMPRCCFTSSRIEVRRQALGLPTLPFNFLLTATSNDICAGDVLSIRSTCPRRFHRALPTSIEIG